ncbi:MAG: DUF4105 domain-containing protein [Leptospiraceae bacterium]|nr:DUF4105 domain-containing protein [Leptospiraceae bacterium]
MAARILALIFILSGLLSSGSLLARQRYSPKQLETWSANGNLHRSPYWQKLLAYKKELFSYKSAADGKAFFFSREGSSDPEAELKATIRAFLLPVEDNPNKHAICRFPARFHWLVQTLSLDRDGFPRPLCSDFLKFSEHLESQSISYVFASFYSGHPASLFGHTFLKFNRSDSTDVSVVAGDPTLSYGARVTSTNPLVYFTDGMFGGFDGTLELQPFRNHLQTYTEGEQRDLWEFRLNLKKPEIQQLVRAAWEMNSTHYDYYFLGENCSYRLLNLLELARPGLDLVDGFFWTVHPADTAKVVVDGNEMATAVVYYPSTESRYRYRIMLLSAEARKAVIEISEGREPPSISLESQQWALVYDLAGERVLLRADNSGSLNPDQRKLLESILQSRDKWGNPAVEGYNFIPDGRNPLIGHESTLISMASGSSSNGSFAEIRFRPALHDLHDRARGYSPYGELEFFSGKVRQYARQGNVELEEFILMNMVTMDPITDGIYPLAWEMQIGIRSIASLYDQPSEWERALNLDTTSGDVFQHNVYTHFRGGLSWEPLESLEEGSFLLYSLFGLTASGGNGQSSQLVPSMHVGFIVRPYSVWSMRVEYLGTAYTRDSRLSREEIRLMTNLAFTRSIALELGQGYRPDTGYSETLFSLKYYF